MYFWEWEFGCPLGIHPIEVGILLELYLLVQKQQNWEIFLRILRGKLSEGFCEGKVVTSVPLRVT